MGKIGFHIEEVVDPGHLFDRIDRVGPDDLIFVGTGTGIIPQVRKRWPAIRCHRRFWEYPNNEGDEGIEKKVPAEQYFRDCVVPQQREDPGVIIAVSNESVSSPDAQFFKWHTDLCDMATSVGARLSLAGCSVGTPLNLDALNNGLADGLWEAMRRGPNGGHIWRANEYWGFWSPVGIQFEDDGRTPIDDIDGPPRHPDALGWHCGRFRRYVPRDILVLVGEHGADTLAGDSELKPYWDKEVPKMAPVPAEYMPRDKWGFRRVAPIWKERYPGHTVEWAYARNLIWAARYIYNTPQALGQMVFCYTKPKKPDWWQFNLVDVGDEFYELVGAYNRSLTEVVSVAEAEAPPMAAWAKPAIPGGSTPLRVVSPAKTDDDGEEALMAGSAQDEALNGRTPLEIQLYQGQEWARDHGGYGNTASGLSQALQDLFPGYDIEMQVKIANGTRLVGAYVNSSGVKSYNPALGGSIVDAQSATVLARQFEANGVGVRYWYVPKGADGSWRREVEQIARVANDGLGAGARGLILDVEPYDPRYFWGPGRPASDVKRYIEYLVSLLPAGYPLWLSADIRARKLEEIQWAAWAPHISRLYAQGYWHEMHLPRARGMEIYTEKLAKYAPGLAGVITLPWYIYNGAWPTDEDMRIALAQVLATGDPLCIFRDAGYGRMKRLAGLMPPMHAPVGNEEESEPIKAANGVKVRLTAAEKATPRVVRENKAETVGWAGLAVALAPVLAMVIGNLESYPQFAAWQPALDWLQKSLIPLLIGGGGAAIAGMRRSGRQDG